MAKAPAAGGGQTVEEAHRRLLEDRTLQFDLDAAAPPPPPRPPPAWLEALGDFINALGPVMQVVFWGGLAVIAGLILFFIGREVLRLRYGRRPKPAKPAVKEPDWRPEEKAARVLLADADRLAADGRFAEAVRLLLIRSIEDIDSRRPHTVKRAYTAREIASLQALPESARPAFGKIAAVVERSLFGGAPVDRDQFADCRQAYEAFALPTGWSR